MATKGIFCLEGLWYDDLRKQSTVKPILDLLHLNSEIPYIHSDCATVNEIDFYLKRWLEADYLDYPILYLAFHGKEHGIWVSDDFYTLEEIGNILEGKCKNRIIIFASCSTINIDKRYLKKFLDKTAALAICGYKLVVPWIESTAFELMLLATLQQNSFDGRGLPALTKKIKTISNMFSGLQFRIVTRAEIIIKNKSK